MQNVIKIYYVVKSYEHYQELLTDGRAQIVIIVQTKGSCNSTIVLPRYYDNVYIFVFVNIEIKTLELFTCKGWLHTLGL